MCSGGAFIRDKMTFIFACLVYALLICVPCNSLNAKRQACKPVIGSNGCRCIHSAGNGIDLMVLRERSEWLKAEVIPNHTIYFQPCENRLIGNTSDDQCLTGSLFLFNNESNKYINLGYANESSLIDEPILDDTPFLRIKHGNITTSIKIICDQLVDLDDSKLKYNSGLNTDTYNLELISKAACYVQSVPIVYLVTITDRGLSTGSVLVILFFTLSAIYFFGGAIALKLLRGAQGREMIPNYTFWSKLPELVKDGVAFTLAGCTIPTGAAYDSI